MIRLGTWWDLGLVSVGLGGGTCRWDLRLLSVGLVGGTSWDLSVGLGGT